MRMITCSVDWCSDLINGNSGEISLSLFLILERILLLGKMKGQVMLA